MSLTSWHVEIADAGTTPTFQFIYSPGFGLYFAYDLGNNLFYRSNGNGAWSADTNLLPAGWFFPPVVIDGGAGFFGSMWGPTVNIADQIVGGGNSDLNPFARFIGGAWQQVSVPIVGLPGGTTEIGITSIWGNAGHTWAAGWIIYPGFAASACVFHSTDGGFSWTATKLRDPVNPASVALFRGIYVINPDDVWAVGYDRSPAGVNFAWHWDGIIWTEYLFEVETDFRMVGVWASSSNDVWIADGIHLPGIGPQRSHLYHTTDQGSTFTAIQPPQVSQGEIFSGNGFQISGTGPNDFWISLGGDFKFLQVTENGYSFSAQNLPFPATQVEGSFATPEKIFAVSNGTLFAASVSALSAVSISSSASMIPGLIGGAIDIDTAGSGSFSAPKTDISIGNENFEIQKFNFVRDTDGDVSFDGTEAHAVMSSILEDAAGYWADPTHGNKANKVRNLTSRTASQVESMTHAALQSQEDDKTVEKVKVTSTTQLSKGRLSTIVEWTTPAGQPQSKKANV